MVATPLPACQAGQVTSSVFKATSPTVAVSGGASLNGCCCGCRRQRLLLLPLCGKCWISCKKCWSCLVYARAVVAGPLEPQQPVSAVLGTHIHTNQQPYNHLVPIGTSNAEKHTMPAFPSTQHIPQDTYTYLATSCSGTSPQCQSPHLPTGFVPTCTPVCDTVKVTSLAYSLAASWMLPAARHQTHPAPEAAQHCLPAAARHDPGLPAASPASMQRQHTAASDSIAQRVQP